MSLPSRIALLPVLASLVATAAPARAVEFQLDGYDRTRLFVFDTLSLSRDAEQAEADRTFVQQRLRLNPHLVVNPHIHVFGQIDLLDLEVFGSAGEVTYDTGLDAATEPPQLTSSVIPGDTFDSFRTNAVVKRAWGEVWTPHVDLRFGRMGNHWGMGLLANDGNDATFADYGDTVDRVQLLARLGPVHVSLAVDTYLEGLINDRDDVWGLTLAGGFLSDVHSEGLYLHWRRMPSNSWDALYADLWGRTHLGPLYAELEAALIYGQGNTDDIENLQVLSGGGALRVGIVLMPIGGELEVGLASGDKDVTDSQVHTFTMDRDHDVALMLFEETMPSFRGTEADPIDESLAVTGEGVSNAFYFKFGPMVYPRDNLQVRLDFIAAQRLVDEDEELKAEDKHLAIELDLGATWTLYQNVDLGARIGVMFPGPMYEPYRDTAFGSEIRAIIRF